MKRNLKLEDLLSKEDLKDIVTGLDVMLKVQPLIESLYEEWQKRQPKAKPKRRKLPNYVRKDIEKRFS